MNCHQTFRNKKTYFGTNNDCKDDCQAAFGQIRCLKGGFGRIDQRRGGQALFVQIRGRF